jgi:large repetitive protein
VTYTPNANTSGSDSFAFKMNNGAANSTPATVGITVNFVNQPPSFTPGGNQTVAENAGAQSVANWATNISPGPNQSSETVHFNITNFTNSSLFSAAPVVSPTGTLTFTPASNAAGVSSVSVDNRRKIGFARRGSACHRRHWIASLF